MLLNRDMPANPTPHPAAREPWRLDRPSKPRLGGRERYASPISP